jgi:hypothetical protein
MFIALLKICTVDIYLLRADLICLLDQCHDTVLFKGVQALGLAALILGSFFLLQLYRSFMPGRRPKKVTPEQVHLSLWANAGLALVVLLILWLATPWVGYLTVGHAAPLFLQAPWKLLVVLNAVVLLTGFWKLEECLWVYGPEEKKKKNYQLRIWTPRDTLWLSAILFMIALAFAYASNDALSGTMPRSGSHLQINLDDMIDLNAITPPGLAPPAP